MMMAIGSVMMILALTVFPLFIPVAVTLVHFVMNWRQHEQ